MPVITGICAVGRLQISDLGSRILFGTLQGMILGTSGILRFGQPVLVIDPEMTSRWGLWVLPATVLAVVLCGSLVGSCLPMIFERIGLDPVPMSNPFVAGIIDIVGIVIYMNVAIMLLV